MFAISRRSLACLRRCILAPSFSALALGSSHLSVAITLPTTSISPSKAFGTAVIVSMACHCIYVVVLLSPFPSFFPTLMAALTCTENKKVTIPRFKYFNTVLEPLTRNGLSSCVYAVKVVMHGRGLVNFPPLSPQVAPINHSPSNGYGECGSDALSQVISTRVRDNASPHYQGVFQLRCSGSPQACFPGVVAM